MGDNQLPALPCVMVALVCVLALVGCGYSPYAEGEKAAEPGGADKKPLQLGGYNVGFVHPTNVKSVYVQVFSSLEFRREVEYRLTEALVKRIVSDTQYTIAKKEQADTVLEGEVKSMPVTLLGSDFSSQLPKECQTVLIVDWKWTNRRTGEAIRLRRAMEQAGDYIPLAGESFYDGSKIAINRMAERIVEAMEADW